MFRVVPVRVMKSKRTTSVCSSSTRTSSRDDIDEVDGRRSSDESDDSDDEKEQINDVTVTFEYVHGAASPALHYKLPKSAEPTSTTTIITSQASVSSRKNAKASAKASMQPAVSKKNQQQVPESTIDSSSDECASKAEIANHSLFLKLLNTIREFFYNRKNWSVTEESIIIWLGFMLFAVVVGCILHFLMAWIIVIRRADK